MINKYMLWRKTEKGSRKYGKMGRYYYFKEVREDITGKETLVRHGRDKRRERVVGPCRPL